MAVSYTCPNPECGVTMKSPSRVAAGKSVKCPKCGKSFVPESGDAEPVAAGGTFKFADDDASKKPAPPPRAPSRSEFPKKEEPAKEAPAKEEPAKQSAPAPNKSPFADDDDESAESVKKGYGVITETEAEKEEAEKNKPTFTEVQDKFKKSARGPAQGLLVLPSQLLTGEGLLTIIGGILMFVVGMWPLVFNDGAATEEELDEAVISMLLGFVIVVWGAMICWGASNMHELGSYPMAMAGSIMGVVPLLVGIFGIVMLQNPKVKAGFEEVEGESDEADDDEEKEDEDEEDDDDDDDDDDDEEEDDDDEEEDKRKKPKRKEKKKVAKKGSRDEDDE